MLPPKHPEYTIWGSRGSTAMWPLSHPPTWYSCSKSLMTVGGTLLGTDTVELSCWAP